MAIEKYSLYFECLSLGCLCGYMRICNNSSRVMTDINNTHHNMIISRIQADALGIVLSAVVAFIAYILSQHFSVPVMLLCLFLGMILHGFSKRNIFKCGIDFTARTVLRIGVVLIGTRIMFSDFIALGWETLALVIFATVLTIVTSLLFAKFLKLDPEQGFLIGGATAICGASAALALSAMMPTSKTLEKNTIVTVVGVTLMGTVAMVIYPYALGVLGLSVADSGLLIGGTIHDVSQTVGAGYSVSENVGDAAILVKLIRVFMLVPILLCCALWFHRQKTDEMQNKPSYPLFLLWFIGFVVLSSFQFIPGEISVYLKDISKACLMMAIAAVGMKTSMRALWSVGLRPALLIVTETLALVTLYGCVIAFGLV